MFPIDVCYLLPVHWAANLRLTRLLTVGASLYALPVALLFEFLKEKDVA